MADEEFVDPLIGAKLGPCRVEERLAAGGMGVQSYRGFVPWVHPKLLSTLSAK